MDALERAGAAAIERREMSRPVRVALETLVIHETDSVLDYGCGHGEDLRALAERGVEATGWDPVHRPEGELRPAAVVNLGYVLNVLESPAERAETARKAWSYARKALVVAVRTNNELGALSLAQPQGDGWLTAKGTFQRFYGQHEAREWLNGVLDAAVIPLSIGVFVAFKDETVAQEWLDVRQLQRRRIRRLRRPTEPRLTKRDHDYHRHAELLAPLEEYLADRGRLPERDECSWIDPIVEAYGSLPKAFQVIRHVATEPFWEDGAAARAEELTVRFALDRLRKRPKLRQLPRSVQRDVKALLGSYKAACERADELLFSAGDLEAVKEAASQAPVGKYMPEALYLHTDYVDTLPAVLRVYLGCAEALIGAVTESNVVKLRLDKPRVSYMVYPDFERDPHPALAESWVVDLQALDVAPRDYRARDNPPVLHRKDLFVGQDHPLSGKFARLTAQEARHGLLEDAAGIGTRQGWEARLAGSGWRLRGHRLVRA